MALTGVMPNCQIINKVIKKTRNLKLEIKVRLKVEVRGGVINMDIVSWFLRYSF